MLDKLNKHIFLLLIASLVLILISELEDKSRSTSSKTRSFVSLFISDAFEVKKYYSDVDVWTKVLICSSNDGFFK